jgi:diguanylate cyclase (GGDEF)-like protein/PAS domain S-box-containing protein
MTVSSSDGAVVPRLTVGDIANRSLLTCPPGTPVAEAAAAMRRHRYSSIVVVEDGRAVGIWTERDALRLDATGADVCDLPISAIMTPHVLTIRGEVSVQEAALRFRERGIRHFLVVDDDGGPLGMVTQTDVVLNHGVEHYLTFREVQGVMTRPLIAVPGEMSLLECAKAIDDAGGEAAVVEGAEPGIVTERDIVRAVAERRLANTVGQLASRPLVALSPHDSLLRARNLFVEHGIRHLAVRDAQGRYLGLLSFSNLLNAMQHEYARQLNEALRERDEALLKSRKDLVLARKVIESAQDGVMICTRDGTIEFVNPAFETLTGYAASEVLGQNPRILQSGRHDRHFYGEMWDRLLGKGNWQGEIWNRRKNGEIYAEWLTITVLRGDDGEVSQYAAVFSDITERKRMEEKVRNLAYFDALTGLPNRRLLLDRLGQAIANAHRHDHQLALMFLDLDLFKRINDTLGHAAGDAVLQATAARLFSCVREGDTVARIGGDEFVVLLPEIVDAADSAKLAERIIDAVRQPVHYEDRDLYVTTSIGIALYPTDATDLDALMTNADAAMYRSKEIGRNMYHLYSPVMNSSSLERLAMEQRLRRAMEEGSFALAYQVKVDVTTGRMCGAEALLRWNDPVLGMVMPEVFVPVAEKMGIMPAVGEWVLRVACAQNRRWQDLGLPPVRMAVNVSAYQFRDEHLLGVVDAVLAETGLEPRWLELELVEAAIVQRPDEVSAVLAELHKRGVRIAIDDFGTGHSSLTALRRLPIDALKIDRSFIAHLEPGEQDADLVMAIIGLAHTLGMDAVAEGVENMAQIEFLRRHRCDEIQGYLISRPMSAENLEDLFDQDLLPR